MPDDKKNEEKSEKELISDAMKKTTKALEELSGPQAERVIRAVATLHGLELK